MLEYTFKSMLITSLIGSVLTVFLTLIRPITKKFFSSRWHYYVWLVVLIAMIIPFRFIEQIDTQQNDNYVIYSPIEEANQDGEMLMNDDIVGAESSIFKSLKLFIENEIKTISVIWFLGKYSLQGTTQGRYLTGGVPPVRFSM